MFIKNIIISIFIYIFKFITCSIYIQIETLQEKNYANFFNANNNNHINIIKKNYFNELYTILDIGSPLQKIFLFIKTTNQDYNIISSKTYMERNNKNNKYNLIEFYKEFNLYNEKESKTYFNEGCKEILGLSDDFETICDSNDIFIFNQIQKNETKKIQVNNFSFKLIKETDSNIPGMIGLGLFDKSRNEAHNFLKVLKNYKLIDNYYYYFDFDNVNSVKGKLIIGALPHEINPNKFSENNLLFTNVDIDSFDIKKWRILFEEIKINNEMILLNKKAEFDFNMNFIIGTNDLEKIFNEKIFNNYINNKMCFNDTFNYSFYSGYKFYYCKSELKKTLYDLLPNIDFFSKQLNFTFNLNKEDLFIIENNYIYLRIIFNKQKTDDKFILGKCFTLKYQFVFNPDLQKIGFYKKSNKIKINRVDIFDYDIIIKIFAIIFLIIIIFVSILKFTNVFRAKRKKRNNKLIEKYDYDYENKDINKKCNQKSEFVEMNINL